MTETNGGGHLRTCEGRASGSDEAAAPDIGLLWFVALVALALVLQLATIWAYKYPPLIDLPFHAARHYLEYLQLSGEELPPFYSIHYGILPNLGSDLVVPLLMHWFSPLTASKMFLSFSVIIYWLGPAVFILRLNGLSKGAVAAAILLLPLSFNRFFLMGFLNYYSGVGIAFLVLAHFLALRTRGRVSPSSIAVHSVLVTLLFFWHLVPVCIYWVVVACFVACDVSAHIRHRGRAWCGLRRAAPLVAASAPAFLLFAIYALSSFLQPRGGPWVWNRLLMKAGDVLKCVFVVYDPGVDAISMCLWAGLAFWGWRKAFSTKLAGPQARAGLSFLALAALFLFLPRSIGQAGWIDCRLLPPILVCGVAMLGPLKLKRHAPWLAMMACCLLVRHAFVFQDWGALADRLSSHAESFAVINPESRVCPVLLGRSGVSFRKYPELHFLGWGVIEKHILVPGGGEGLLCYADQFTLRLNPPYDGYAPMGLSDRAGEYYDYAWVYDPDRERTVAPDRWKLVFSKRGLSVWKLPGQELK